MNGAEPSRDCPFCPRLAGFREEWRAKEPLWHNAPVPTFGSSTARLLVVGLAPGLRGANRTGRPFTGDYAGDLLYQTLLDYGFARGRYAARADDGMTLVDAAVTNAVRCVPPQNKPLPQEINTCRAFLVAALGSMRNLAAIVALGRVAHDSVTAALAARRSQFPFRHGACHRIPGAPPVYDSYHCSRYNTNTGVLTEVMFRDVFAAVRHDLDQRGG